MQEININFEKSAGKVKPMHAVNNGPVYKFASDQLITNIDSWKDAGIPYARTHDASFCSTYGGSHTVDVNAIFPDFDKDPYDPASYDFPITDYYMKVIEAGGTKVFYRLGSKIEHEIKKYNTLPPKNFKKWAVICEHIIRHYTEGWADGFKMDMEYWEIWNEPDLDDDDSDNKRCWGGTKKQYFELYDIAATHLKKCFPHLKIGGPALAYRLDWGEEFLSQLKAPLDFFSWHCYSCNPRVLGEQMHKIRDMLDRHGFKDTESILNEWNYVRSFEGEQWIYTIRNEKGLKGASFIACAMCLGQYAPLDMLMYYDARPCSMNGMFNTDLVCDCLKGYYPFKMFNNLYTLDEAVPAECIGDDIYTCAAKGKNKKAVMLSYFNDDDSTPADKVKIHFSALDKPCTAKIYLLDETKDLEFVREEKVSGNSLDLELDVTLFCSYLIVLE